MSLGTPHYMSPEQATAEKNITARSDVYSLASVLYEMLAGQPPHLGGSAQQIIMKIVTEQAPPVTQMRKSVPANVVAATARALEKLPADRFESAKAFADAQPPRRAPSSSHPCSRQRAGTSASGSPSGRSRPTAGRSRSSPSRPTESETSGCAGSTPSPPRWYPAPRGRRRPSGHRTGGRWGTSRAAP
jgi:serine/threonine protein kinase